METVTLVHGVFSPPSATRTRRCFAASFRLRAKTSLKGTPPVPSHGANSEERQKVAAKRTSGGVVLDSITLRAAMYALEGMGPVTEGSAIDPLLAETGAGISISIRCVDERKAKRAEALLRGAGAQEVSTEGSLIG